jgi:DNA ligase (NAD+)
VTTKPVGSLSLLEANAELAFLRSEIRRHDDLYYNKAMPELSDPEYDALRSRLYAIEEKFPVLVSSTSPSRRIGAPVDNSPFAKVRHRSPMLSLENAFSVNDVEKFFARAAKFLSLDLTAIELCGEQKIDGLSASVIYNDGKISHGSTRGNGFIGEDITRNLTTISDIPKTIQVHGEVEVRGEVYIRTEHFNSINAEKISAGETPFSSPRNVAAGSLRQVDSTITASRHLQFFAYYISASDNVLDVKTQVEALGTLRDIGFSVAEHRLCKNMADVNEFYRAIMSKRDSLGYEIDGTVFKVNSIPLQKRLGFSGRNPRHSVAFKFSASEAETMITDIELGVGRTGKITPVAIINPVSLSGAIISRVTLHNFDEIARKCIAVGDTISISRAGDVIPKIVSITKKSNNKMFEIPLVCPSCGSPVTRREGVVDVYCENRYSCPEQVVSYMEYFASENCFDIVGLGKKQIEEFYTEGRIKTAADIFRLREKELEYGPLSKKPGWGTISVNILYNTIEAQRHISLWKFIMALAIPGVGEVTAKLLADRFSSVESLIAASSDDIAAINGIGTTLTKKIRRFLDNEINAAYIRELLESVSIDNDTPSYGVNPNGKYYRKTIVFTGTMTGISRERAKQLAISSGAFVSSVVSSKTDFVIVGERAGNKLKYAQGLGVAIVPEEEFIASVDVD